MSKKQHPNKKFTNVTQRNTIIGNVRFPYTLNKEGAGFGRIIASSSAQARCQYISIPQGNHHGGWLIDQRLTENSDTFSSILSALNAKWGGKEVFVSLVFEDGSRLRLGGASCGLAAFLALFGIKTEVVVTGYVQSFGIPAADIPIYAVDSVDEKIEFAQLHNELLIVPATSDSLILQQMIRQQLVTTVNGMVYNQGPDVFTLGAVKSFTDLAFVLCAMDSAIGGSLKVKDFFPRHEKAFFRD